MNKQEILDILKNYGINDYGEKKEIDTSNGDDYRLNAFFEKDGKILSTVQAAADAEMTGDFLRIGTHDLMKFRDVCSKWNKTVPKQIKMIYDVKTGKFNADISYESRIPYELNGGNIFMEWMEQEKNKRN